MPHRVSRAWCLERQLGPSDWVSGVARRDTSTGRSVHLNLRQSVAAQLAGECFRRYPRPGAVISPGRRTLTVQVATSSTSRSLPVTFSLLSRAASSTFASNRHRLPTLDYADDTLERRKQFFTGGGELHRSPRYRARGPSLGVFHVEHVGDGAIFSPKTGRRVASRTPGVAL